MITIRAAGDNDNSNYNDSDNNTDDKMENEARYVVFEDMYM